MNNKRFPLSVNTINGEIYEFPQEITVVCGQILLVGPSVVREYDGNTDCIIAKRVLLFKYGGNVFGTSQFTTINEFNQYLSGMCSCCDPICYIQIGDCNIAIGDCFVSMT